MGYVIEFVISNITKKLLWKLLSTHVLSFYIKSSESMFWNTLETLTMVQTTLKEVVDRFGGARTASMISADDIIQGNIGQCLRGDWSLSDQSKETYGPNKFLWLQLSWTNHLMLAWMPKFKQPMMAVPLWHIQRLKGDPIKPHKLGFLQHIRCWNMRALAWATVRQMT